MASVANDPGGRRRVLFIDPNGDRKTLRLGKLDRKTAESVCRHVEALLASNINGQPLARETAVWLSGIASTLKDKLAKVGLIEPEQRLMLDQHLANWLEGKRAAGHKPTSIRAWKQTVDAVNKHLPGRLLTSLKLSDGESFRGAMQLAGLRSATIHKRLNHTKAMLEDAVRLGLLTTNPWKYVKQRLSDPGERRVYVTVDDVQRVIEHCPNLWWKLLVALARFGGLRIPSEAFSLTWGDIDWERRRISVPSPKTEHLGKSHRVIPLFPLLLPYLEAAFDQAPERSEFLFPDEWRARACGPMGWGGANLRTMFAKIIRKAGVDPWSRVWHSLRASCESDLAQHFPLATVTKWLGNTPSVALKHYVDPTETAFEKAVTWQPESGAKYGARDVKAARNTAQQAPVESSNISHDLDVSLGYEAGYTEPCEMLRQVADKCTNEQRECIGIEPTGSVVHTPHRF